MKEKVEEVVVEEEVISEEKVKEEELKEDEELLSVVSSSEKSKIYTKEVNGFDLVIKFKLANMRQKTMADIMYSKQYNKLLQDQDHLTTAQLLKNAEIRGIWTVEDEKRTMNIDSDIITTKDKLAKEKNKSKKEKLEADLLKFRDEKFRLAVKVGQITGTAIEVLSEQERTSYMLTHCIYVVDSNGDDSLLYPTRADLDDEQDLKKLEAVLLEGKSFWSGEGLTDFLHLGD
jgi:hypothetical protein